MIAQDHAPATTFDTPVSGGPPTDVSTDTGTCSSLQSHIGPLPSPSRPLHPQPEHDTVVSALTKQEYQVPTANDEVVTTLTGLKWSAVVSSPNSPLPFSPQHQVSGPSRTQLMSRPT